MRPVRRAALSNAGLAPQLDPQNTQIAFTEYPFNHDRNAAESVVARTRGKTNPGVAAAYGVSTMIPMDNDLLAGAFVQFEPHLKLIEIISSRLSTISAMRARSRYSPTPLPWYWPPPFNSKGHLGVDRWYYSIAAGSMTTRKPMM
jgi:hypothetical protein